MSEQADPVKALRALVEAVGREIEAGHIALPIPETATAYQALDALPEDGVVVVLDREQALGLQCAAMAMEGNLPRDRAILREAQTVLRAALAEQGGTE